MLVSKAGYAGWTVLGRRLGLVELSGTAAARSLRSRRAGALRAADTSAARSAVSRPSASARSRTEAVRGRRGDPDSSPRTVRTFRPVRSASCSWVSSARCRHSRSRVPSLGSSRARPLPAAPHEPMANDIPIVSGKCRAKDRLMPGCLPDIHTTSPVRAHGGHRSGCRQHRQMSGRCPVGCLDPGASGGEHELPCRIAAENDREGRGRCRRLLFRHRTRPHLP
jgi:hypothetical protein